MGLGFRRGVPGGAGGLEEGDRRATRCGRGRRRREQKSRFLRTLGFVGPSAESFRNHWFHPQNNPPGDQK